ncbi:MOSC-domain-containing protein [Viridothelium virens]|uniref:MOSC-domain-containing protein n=1 Tax=Viridothelium virens TaxID=1048519 RepID=A0A6A6HJE7_VIRVR|nr:MOSC-domain-containing protein [Viridothelium virens]
MSGIPVDWEFFEHLRSPPAIVAFVIIFVAILYAALQDTPHDPFKSLLSLLSPKFNTEITSLRIYPIKSCRGIPVTSRKLLKTGLFLDRNWMFVDAATNKFITIRQHSKMTLIDTALSDDQLHISIRGTGTQISILAPPPLEWLQENCVLCSDVEIWGDKTDAWMYPADLTKPFGALLGPEIRLVYKAASQPRLCDANGSPELLGRMQNHHFADMMSVLVGSEASLAELNRRLAAGGHDELTIERFRPNIIVRGGEPWSEDRWKRLRIYTPGVRTFDQSLKLDCPARCLRCQVPNVNPETGVKHDAQPWKTLCEYRRIDLGFKGKPVFGMLCVPANEGVIEVGMRLEVVETTGKHHYTVAHFKDL